MTRPRPAPQPPVRHAGSRTVPYPPNLARIIAALDRRIKDATMRPVLDLLPVTATAAAGTAATASSWTTYARLWVYRSGAAVYVDVDVWTGTASVVAIQLTCPDLGVTGTWVETGNTGGEWVMRAQLNFPDAWNPGDSHFVAVQAYRVSGTDATAIQVARAWQR